MQLLDLLPTDFELSQPLGSQEYYQEEESKFMKRRPVLIKPTLLERGSIKPKTDQEVLDMLTSETTSIERILAPENPRKKKQKSVEFEDYDLIIPSTPPRIVLSEELTQFEIESTPIIQIKKPPLIPVGVIKQKKSTTKK